MKKRNPQRIPKLCSLLSLAWLEDTDARLGQLVDRAAHFGGWRHDIFSCEDDVIAKGLENLMAGKPPEDGRIPNYTYLVVRRPLSQKDEGRYSVAGTFDSLVEAEKWIENQRGEYFPPAAYFIVRD